MAKAESGPLSFEEKTLVPAAPKFSDLVTSTGTSVKSMKI